MENTSRHIGNDIFEKARSYDKQNSDRPPDHMNQLRRPIISDFEVHDFL
jgi:hypothetical protein